ncbi:unnamed protein product [Lymnaea stagnalis]|uniref:Brix domain-containing protein n=1 Tax=Lymnaea stagnalis TaxID=6523 RepID=A0AAV2H1T6_LYMST
MGRKKGKKGKAARNAKAGQPTTGNEEEVYLKAPHSFVFHRGHVGRTVKDLVFDVRKIMEPYTASNLRVRKKNVMKDFLTIAGPLHVSHFIAFTKTDIATYMKLICVPRGPTLTFKVNEFCLSKDVLSFQKHPDVESKLFANHAVMVTNIPSDTMENKLMNVTFKNMFPSINPNTVKLNNMRRTVLVNYDTENKSLDLRHYTMKVVPTGVSRAMKKLMKSKLPNLGHHEDIADLFLEKGLSDSEGEQDGPHNQVTVTQKVKGRGVTRNAVNAIRLKEIGPRLSLQLVKIEEGFEGGNVLFHSLIEKTEEELEALKLMRQQKQKEKMARKQKQEANVRKKQEVKQEHIKKTLEGMKRKQNETETDKESEEEGDEQSTVEANAHEDSDDDVEYYKQEVGEEPEPEMFSKTRKRKVTKQEASGPSPKRQRQDKPRFKRQDKSGGSGPRDIKEKRNRARNAGTEVKNKRSKFSVKFGSKSGGGKKMGDKREGKKKSKFNTVHNKVKKPMFRPKTNKRR